MADHTRRVSGRELHDAKITVYLTPGELLRIDHSLLELRRLYGVKIDRSRLVREALAGISLNSLAAKVRADG